MSVNRGAGMKTAVAKLQPSQVLSSRWQTPGILAATVIGLLVVVLAFTIDPELTGKYVKVYGSVAGKLSVFALLLLPFLLLQRRRLTVRYALLGSITRFLRKWHIPAAILVLGCTIAHMYLAVANGFVINFRNVTGILALVIMAGVYGSGLVIPKANWRKLHIVSGVAFAGVLLLHMAK